VLQTKEQCAKIGILAQYCAAIENNIQNMIIKRFCFIEWL